MDFQLFRTERDDLSNYAIWQFLHRYTIDGLKVFFANAYKTYAFGEILYNERYGKLCRVIAKDIFLNSYDAIFRSLNKAGTYENLISIIRAVFGADAAIEFSEPAPAVLNVNIVQNASQVVYWKTKDRDLLTDTEDGGKFVLTAMVRQIYLDEIINLFRQILIPSGIYFTIQITHQ
ncbi:MAG: hypothetical protein LBH29_04355 [Elusimicrobiota bacterium]|jgi:tRNA(Glu) U13 pseudouridine synthase TruD|nr:hypothetical protein [Elusimicrobiota bacterium]